MAKRKQREVLPPQGLPVAVLHLNLADGEHPTHARPFTALHELDALNPPTGAYTLHLPLAPHTNGHHMLEDDGYLATVGQSDAWPLAPVFVRDLAGRIIHTGLNPLPIPPKRPLMPETCRYVPPETQGYELLDKIFFTTFRRLEWAYGEGAELSGRPNIHLHAVYPAPHLYPYKLRVDSFYQDGFRLPQVERLYVHPSTPTSESAGQALLTRWQSRPQGQTYQQFHEANHGDTWFEEMFQQGCTVIPTFEATNGSFIVTADYGIADAHPGCVVEGLHDVLDYQASDAPAGTILEVITPGYATRDKVVSAHVIASDGSGYVSPLGEIPDPFQPNPTLPHTRVGSFENVWLPTHPGHFELPALWNWNAQGHFVQMAGPLWDSLHYTYASTPHILKAFRKTSPEMPDLAPVPNDMLPRFHPVVALKSYDTFNTTTRDFRQQQAGSSPFHLSAIDTVPLGRETAGVGYHPLPPALEYDLLPHAFPYLGPRHNKAEIPQNAAPVITSTVTTEEARKLAVIYPEPAQTFLLKPEHFQGGYGLERYTSEAPSLEWPGPWCHLPNPTTSDLMTNVKRFFASKAYVEDLKAVAPDLYTQFFTFREQSLSTRRLIHRLIRKYPGWAFWMWWFGHTLEHTEAVLADNPDFNLLESEKRLRLQAGAHDIADA